jgi:hypothetical protein
MICIGILNDGRIENGYRINQYKLLLYYLSKSKYISNYTVVVLSVSENNIFQEIADKYNISFNFIATDISYMSKIYSLYSYCKNLNYNYIFKIDNDIVLPSYIFDFIYENKSCLDIDNSGILLPVLTNSIPSIDYIIEDFFSKEEKKTIYKIFEDYKYTNEWEHLNQLKPIPWSSSKWFSIINSNISPHNGFYKAVHPIRYSHDATVYLNEIIMKYYNTFNESRECYLYEDINKEYFMPQVFLMKTDVFKYIFDDSLRYDEYDEVTLNRLIKRDNRKVYYIRNSFSVHVAHNGYTHNFLEYEKDIIVHFFKEILNKI